MPYWYKPKLSRQEAVSYLRDKDVGCFIVRDSATVKGSYALSVKVSPEQARARKKLPRGTGNS